VRVGILTLSTRASQGVYADESGLVISRFVEEKLGYEIAETAVLPDEQGKITETLLNWTDERGLDLILTTGGTGFSPRDVTPEATRAVIERDAPGLAEAMRAASLRVTPHAMLSRAVCGIRRRTLIINLPGSPKAVRENLDVLLPILPHALDLLTEAPGSEAGHNLRKRA
jgi:molybdenum cofactor synthesis domain-containing protein